MTQLPSEKPELFKGRHFNHLIIIQAVRWYVTYKLSYRSVCDLMAERGVTVVHTTVLRWVQCFVSLRQNGVGTGFIRADAILPKGHESSPSICNSDERNSEQILERDLDL